MRVIATSGFARPAWWRMSSATVMFSFPLAEKAGQYFAIGEAKLRWLDAARRAMTKDSATGGRE